MSAAGDTAVLRRQKIDLQQQKQAELAAGYTPAKRRQEVGCISAWWVLWLYSLYRLVTFSQTLPLETVLCSGAAAGVLGLLVADFMSGLVHWACDTWGSVHTSGIGVVLRSFREHHLDATAICRHDFVEVNGDTFMICLPTLAWMAFCNIHPSGFFFVPGTYAWHIYCQMLTLIVALTNQMHKIAHLPTPTWWERMLMDSGLVLTKAHHNLHHRGKHDTHYCITTGWMNPPLELIGFWRAAEAAVTAVTGAIPRSNDAEILSDDVGSMSGLFRFEAATARQRPSSVQPPRS